jgi:hypothetical protein
MGCFLGTANEGSRAHRHASSWRNIAITLIEPWGDFECNRLITSIRALVSDSQFAVTRYCSVRNLDGESL